MAATAMLVGLALGQAAERLLGWPPSVLPPALAFSSVFAALAMLAKVGLGGQPESDISASSVPCLQKLH